MMREWLLASVILSVALAVGTAGCANNPRDTASTTAAGSSSSGARSASAHHAQCLVCKHENDLACLDVEVDNDTPHLTFDGKEYYFCSESCKRDFQKRPDKYLTQK